LCCVSGFAAAIALAAPVERPAVAQQKEVNHPRMRAALHELREARKELNNVKDHWPPGYKERALEAINNAIETLRADLAIRDVDNFVGYDRNPDYYTKFKDHPRIRSAVLDLRQARAELESNLATLPEGMARDLRLRVLDDIDIALGHILVLLRERKK
jgi:hypothetical protein